MSRYQETYYRQTDVDTVIWYSDVQQEIWRKPLTIYGGETNEGRTYLTVALG